MIKGIIGLNSCLVILFVYWNGITAFGFEWLMILISTGLLIFWFGTLKYISIIFFPALWFIFYYNLPVIDPKFNIIDHAEARWMLSFAIMIPTIPLSILMSLCGFNELLAKREYEKEKAKPWLYKRRAKS